MPEAADHLGEVFVRAGHQLHLVGGTVRDALLRPRRPTTSTSPPTPGRRRCSSWCPGWAATWTTGIEFGTVGVLVRGVRCEITTYRADRYDRVSRNPLVAYGDSLADDLRRRDFTMNAMAVSVPGHEFTDPYGGLARPGHAAPCAPRPTRASPSPTTRCGCCGRPGSSPSSASPRPPELVAAMADAGPGDRPDHRRAGAGRADQAAARRAPAARAGAAGRHRAGRRDPARAAGAADGDRRAPPAQGRLRALADRPRPGHRAGGRGSGPGAAAGRAAARRGQAGDPAARAGRRGLLPPPRGGRRQAGPRPAARR